MALAKERSIPREPFMMSSVDNLSPDSPYSPDEFDKPVADGISGDGQSVINFSSFLSNSTTDQSLLSFDPKEEYYSNSDQWNSQSSRLVSADFSCRFQTSSDYSSISNCTTQNGWLYSESTVTTDHSFEESETPESGGFKKRPNSGESGQDAKKQCTNFSAKKSKVQKPITPSKDPQSIAAKNRRERISERLKVLQELVPNGSKVDLVTMLEKAISYVKFLQLQVKVLATDEFWPVQGGKAPNISQVREAIDAILSSSSSSQKDRSSSSK